MIASLLALALGTADPCAPLTAAPTADPRLAAIYRQTGDDQRRAGLIDAATAAYRAAAALDPGDAASRGALQALCQGGSSPADPFLAGLRLMDAHEWRAAAEAFDQAHLASGDLSAALLEGICHYHLGEDVRAEPLLRAAEARPEHQDLARFYLGLIALRAGAMPRAEALFHQASVNPALGALAGDLTRLARQGARLVLTLVADTGYDSNVPLAPKGSTTSGTGSTGGTMGGGGMGLGSMTGDGLYALGASVLFRPSGLDGPYLRAGGFLRRQASKDAYDLGSAGAAAGWQVTRDGLGGLVEYAYSFQEFGSSPYLSAHRLAMAGWLTAGGLTWSARYAAQLEDYRTPTLAGYEGVLHRAEARAALPFGTGHWMALVYTGARDATSLGITSYQEHGPRAELRLVLNPRLRLSATAAVTFRDYDALDTVLGVARSDRYLDAGALLEWEFSPAWTARLALSGHRAISNAAALEYDKIVPMIGLAWQLGL